MRETISARRSCRFRRAAACALAFGLIAIIVPAHAAPADQIYFSSTTNVTNILVQYINQETVRLDISSWYLSEHAISIAIAAAWQKGVKVRLIGDADAIWQDDPNTKKEFYWLANQGIPIRLRFNPTWFPEIDHWKAAIFVGQQMVEFGSGNFAPTELAPVSSTNFDDDSEMFTTDPALVQAFLTKFDVMWQDTTVEPESIYTPGPPYLMNWYDACANEPPGAYTGETSTGCDFLTQYPNPAPMTISTNRQVPTDYPTNPPGLYWGQGADFNTPLINAINAENSRIGLVVYRLEVDAIAQALLAKWQAGVPVQLIVDPAQYADNAWPEYWLTHAEIDKLYAAGVPILQRLHAGVTHMKTLITSTVATNASSNFASNWQRDNDYFVEAATKPTIYQAFVDRFNAMVSDTVNFGPFMPTPPAAANLSYPAPGATGVPTNVTLVWNTAAWATSYDIYLGTTSANMVWVANVPAQLEQNPPTTYSWTVSPLLQPGQNYDWKVVSRTFATPMDPSMTANSTIQAFTTSSAVTPANPTPTSGATGVGTSPLLSWSGGGTGTTYNLSLGTTNPPPQVATGLGSPSYQPAQLTSATTYFWSVTAVTSSGSATGSVWSFSTAATAGGSPPSPWQNQDVGTTGIAGSTQYTSGAFTVSGAGADIWGTSDAFQYAYQPRSGDGQIIARVTGIQNVNSNAKAGVMLRETPSASAAHVILDVKPGGGIEFMTRPSTGAATTYLAGATQALPAWLKLARSGSTVTASVSADGVTWVTVGTTTSTMATNALMGLAVTSHDTTQLNASSFDSVAVGGLIATQPPGPPASPNPGNGATNVSLSSTLTWSAANATSYDVSFGTTNPPPQVVSGQASASYTPGALASGTTYFWQIVAHNSAGTTTGSVWSFATTSSTSGLPTPWQHQDVGTTGLAGSTSYTSGAFTVGGAGADIWGTADAFQFAYDPVTGDSQIVARVASIQNTNAFAKAGVMLRETTAANAAHVVLDVRPTGDVEFMTRPSTGAATTYLAGATQVAPAWLKLVRSGTTVTASVSADGATWTMVGSTTLSIASSALLGFAVTSHDTTQLNTSTFDNVTVSGGTGSSQPPAAPSAPSPSNGATGVATSPTLSWIAAGATSYDVNFGTANPPAPVSAGQSSASYTPGALVASTTYFWQIVAHNTNGSATGPVWSFTTTGASQPPPPSAPTSPSPANGATTTNTTQTLTWSSTGATSYDVSFGPSNPPARVSAGQTAASYATGPLANQTTYFWQIVSHNAGGTTTGPVWSFVTAAPASSNIVIYASDIPASALHGDWSAASDATSPNGVKLITPATGTSNTSAALAAPADYVDVTFTANAGVPYTFWIRLEAANNSKWSDSVWVQFSDALVNGSPVYPINTTGALLVNLATDSTGSSDLNWGWINGCYWLSQPATVTFATSGTQTLRIQVREAGVMFDQIVLSPTTYLTAAPGGRTNDTTIVPKP